MRSNTLRVNGVTVYIGRTPEIIKQCGFAGPGEVRRVANRWSFGLPKMVIGQDLVEYFTQHYRQRSE